MTAARRRGAALATIAALALLAPACGGAGETVTVASPERTATTTAPAATPQGPATARPAEYRRDVLAASKSLGDFGKRLRRVKSPAQLRRALKPLRAELDAFEAAIADLKGYVLENAGLEAQRAGLARTGPPVSDVLRDFLAAAAAGDPQKVRDLLPKVQKAVADFQAAAAKGA